MSQLRIRWHRVLVESVFEMFLLWGGTIDYKRLDKIEGSSTTDEKVDTHMRYRDRRTTSWRAGLISHAISFCLGFSVAAIIYWGAVARRRSDSYSTGFATEIGMCSKTKIPCVF